MGRATPYQPSLLRLLHGITALFVPLAWLSGLLVLINHDGRWLLLAIGSGKLMDEDWLRTGELEHWPYHLHLLAWMIISGAVIWHVGDVVRRGGLPLAGSMVKLTVRESDRPRHWPKQLLQRR